MLQIARNISSDRFTDQGMSLLVVLCSAIGWDVNFLTTRTQPALVEYLQKSAVDRLTTFRQLEAREFGSVATIVTTDFE